MSIAYVTAQLAVVPYLTAQIGFVGYAVSAPAPLPLAPQQGLPVFYYRPSSRLTVLLTGVADQFGVPVTSATATASVTITNQVTGAVTRSAVAMTYAAPGVYSYTTTADAHVPPTGPLLLSVSVSDPGFGATLFGSFEALLIPQPPAALLYQRLASNRFLVTNLIDSTGVLRTSGTTSLALTIANAYTGAAVVTNQGLAYSSPGIWYLDLIGVFTVALGEPILTVTLDAQDGAFVHCGQWVYTAYRG